MVTKQRSANYSLEDRFESERDHVYLTGLQAVVRILIDHQRFEQRQGLRSAAFVSGYPGSPLAGLDKELQRNRKLLDAHNVVHQPGVNEELAATAVMGSQLVAGRPDPRYEAVVGMWYGKSPGLDRAGDAIKHGNYVGAAATGGVLLVVGDDPQSKSSTLPSASEFALQDALMPVLFPGSAQEVLDLGLHGYRLSRTSGLWAGMKVVTNVADSASSVNVDPHRLHLHTVDDKFAFPITKPDGRLLPPQSVEIEREIHRTRLPLALKYGRVNGLNQVTIQGPNDWLGIVAAGRTYFDLMQALRDLGLAENDLTRLGIRLLKISLLHPFDAELTRRFASGLEEILVVEEKRSFMETFVKDALFGRANAPRVVGKLDESGSPLVPIHGALDADVIAKVVGHRASRRVTAPSIGARLEEMKAIAERHTVLPLTPARAPYYCSGCPHNRSTKVPEGSLVGGGIGCHGMVLWMRPDEFGDFTGLTQMGGEGAHWIGMSPFVEHPHLIQNVGDGTFFHSGQLALRAAVAAGVNVTFKILYNGAVAMTGGQDVPGVMSVPQLTHLLQLEGVNRTIVTTEDPSRYKGVALAPNALLRHRDRLEESQLELAVIEGVTALIHDQQCAAEKRKLRKRGRLPQPTHRIVINERVCEDCGDCGVKSNCLSLQSIETEFGTKTTVHQSSCNVDESCLLGDCPSFVTVDTSPRHGRRGESPYQQPPTGLPEAVLRVPSTDYSVRLVGIGGTGVVTVSQVLGTAALLEGRHVSGLDQTGLSQKGGPVISDLMFSASPDFAGAKLSSGDADALLAFDVLTAASPVALSVTSPKKTVAIVSTERTPTGHMIADNSIAFPPLENLRGSIDAVTRVNDNAYVDSSAIAHRLLHNHMLSNVVTLGAAYQAGAVPLKSESIERALELNGVSVEANLIAFRWGRALVAAPDVAAAAISTKVGTRAARPPDTGTTQKLDEHRVSGELRRILEVRVPDLNVYQSAAYSQNYLDFMLGVLEAERRAISVGSTKLAEGVARNLYKLMAYKDEYEVARLQLDEAFREQLSRELGDTHRIRYHLHPPLLRSLGLKRKLQFGAWVRPLFRLLVASRRLRGTAFDPFGHTPIRRIERDLIREYRSVISSALKDLSPETLSRTCKLAELPDMIRGYEDIKLKNVIAYRRELTQILESNGREQTSD